MASGYGKYVKRDQSFYEGQWVNDVQEGMGFETWISGE